MVRTAPKILLLGLTIPLLITVEKHRTAMRFFVQEPTYPYSTSFQVRNVQSRFPSSIVSNVHNPSQSKQIRVCQVRDHLFGDNFSLTFSLFRAPTNSARGGTLISLPAISPGAADCWTFTLLSSRTIRTIFVLALALTCCCFPDLSPLSSLVRVPAFVAVFQHFSDFISSHHHSIDLE